MPSQLHEALLMLFRNRPALAPELLHEALGVDLPDHTEVRIESADLSEFPPTEYSADLVFLPFARRRACGDRRKRANLYFDLVAASLSDAARKALLETDPARYEYQSDFARRYIAEGEAKGEARGKAEILVRQLTRRFGRVPDR